MRGTSDQVGPRRPSRKPLRRAGLAGRLAARRGRLTGTSPCSAVPERSLDELMAVQAVLAAALAIRAAGERNDFLEALGGAAQRVTRAPAQRRPLRTVGAPVTARHQQELLLALHAGDHRALSAGYAPRAKGDERVRTPPEARHD